MTHACMGREREVSEGTTHSWGHLSCGTDAHHRPMHETESVRPVLCLGGVVVPVASHAYMMMP